MSSVPTISPADRRLPRTWDAAKAAWIDVYRVFTSLPGVWRIALAINVGLYILRVPLTDGNARNTFGPLLLQFLIGGVSAFLLTPYSIAVHRLIILDDVAPSYTLRPRQLRFKKFFSWSLFLWACVGVFEVVFTLLFGFLLLLSGGGAFFISIFVFPAFIFIFSFILCWAMARLSILFPAIAVDAAGASWRNVMSDTRGYAWQIFLIALLASLPFVPVGIALWFSVGHGTVAAVTDGVLGIISITLFVVIASRLYQRLGNNVNQSRAV